jgi:hypothetical protein
VYKIPRVTLLDELQVLKLVLLSVDLVDEQAVKAICLGLDVLEEFGIGGVFSISDGRLLRGGEVGWTLSLFVVVVGKVFELQFAAIADALVACLDEHGTLPDHLRLLALAFEDILDGLMHQLIGVLWEFGVVKLL